MAQYQFRRVLRRMENKSKEQKPRTPGIVPLPTSLTRPFQPTRAHRLPCGFWSRRGRGRLNGCVRRGPQTALLGRIITIVIVLVLEENMEKVGETLSNGLISGITAIIQTAGNPPDQKKIEEAIKSLVNKQVDIVDSAVKQELDTGKQQIMLAELSQGDNFTKRARPAVVYAGLFFILLIHVVAPLVAFFHGDMANLEKLKLPDEFWWAWTGVVSVWVFGRSYEKVNSPSVISQAITGNK